MLIKPREDFHNFYELKHPVVQYKLSLLRDPSTNRKLFEELTEELASMLVYEATRDLPQEKRKIETPLETFEGYDLAKKDFVIVPILRAGLGMARGLMRLLPMSSVGHIGFYRDEVSLQAKKYYFKMPPNSQESLFLVCDPMLATGNTAVAAIDQLKEFGAKNILFICLVAAPEGASKLIKAHPDVSIFAASLDRELNDHGYILPGLGDAGDRLWAVK